MCEFQKWIYTKMTSIKLEGVHVVPFNFYLIYQGMDEWIEKVEGWVAELIFVDELVESIESSHVVHYGWWKNPGTYQPNMYQKPWK